MKLRLLFLFFLASSLAYAQDAVSELAFVVSGTVKDASDGAVIENVSVSVPGTSLATVTNSDGFYRLKSSSPIEAVVFSCLGYGAVRLPVSGDVADVSLHQIAFTLDEAHIISMDPHDLVNEAIDRIRDNYSNETDYFNCFYRETVQKRSRYISIVEAVTDMTKSSYRRLFSSDRVAVRKSRTLLSPRAKDTLSVKVLGGPLQPVDLDAVKDEHVVFNDLEYCQLTMLQPVYIGDRMQFVVQMEPAADLDYPLYYGRLYIDCVNYAFTRMELSLDMSDPGKATRSILVSKPSGLRFKPKGLDLVLSYREEGGAYRLSYLKTEFRFNCDWKRRLFATSFRAVNEMVVTGRVSDPEARIDRKSALKSRDALQDIAEDFADPDFWKDYNIIEPSESLENAIAKLRKK